MLYPSITLITQVFRRLFGKSLDPNNFVPIWPPRKFGLVFSSGVPALTTGQTATMAATNPFTGYSQVDSFGPDEEYLSEENEVTYVTLDLGTVEPTLLSSSSTYRLVVSTGTCLLWHYYN
jgi:hypothetical protein